MNRAIAALAVALMIPAQPAVASDWKYAGYFSAAGSKDSVAFYDSESLARDGVKVRYWVKGIPRKTLDTFAGTPGTKKYKGFIDAAATKVASGYVPPLLTLASVRSAYRGDFADFIVGVIAWEQAANRGAQHVSRFLFEIDCTRKTIRTLAGNLFDNNGNPKVSSGVVDREPRFIAPDTNAAWMSELVCAK